MRALRLLVPSAILLLSSPALAQTQTLAQAPYPPAPMYAAPPPPPPPPERPVRTASITVSPIHLLMPIVEITAEFAVSDKIGLAGIVGVGSVPLKTSTTTISSTGTSTRESTERLSAWEVGGHFNYYVIGDFDHGMQLGVEALYLKIARSEQNYRSAAAADGFAVGPYVGYKIITRVGFTFESNLGVQYVTARAEASDGTTTAQKTSSTTIPLLNLNVGWSF